MSSVMFIALKNYVSKLITSMPSEYGKRFSCNLSSNPTFEIAYDMNKICDVTYDSNREVEIRWISRYVEPKTEKLTFGDAAQSILDYLEVMCSSYFDMVDLNDFFVMNDDERSALYVRCFYWTERSDYPILDLLKRVDRVVKKMNEMGKPLDEMISDAKKREESLQKASKNTKEISESSGNFANLLNELLRKLSGNGATPPGP